MTGFSVRGGGVFAKAVVGGTKRDRGGKHYGMRADLANEVRASAKGGYGVLCSCVEGGKGGDEVAVLDEYPLAHVMSFEVGAESVERRDFDVKGRHAWSVYDGQSDHLRFLGY